MKRPAPRALADLLVSAIPQLADRLPEYHLRRSWSALVGADMARRARPHALASGCLTVVVDNSPWLHELTLRTEELTARLHAQFPAVRSLRFTLGAIEPDASAAPARDRPRAVPLTPADHRDIDTATAVIGDAALAATARRLLITARRFPTPRGDV
jgi:hypothetical protein